MKHRYYPENIFFRSYRVLRRYFYIYCLTLIAGMKIDSREGKCKQCGGCCETVNCFWFMPDKKCLLWEERGKEALPILCQWYPFDYKDMIPYSKAKCGYKFKK